MGKRTAGLLETLGEHRNKGFTTIDALYAELSAAVANAEAEADGPVGEAGPAGGGYAPNYNPSDGPGGEPVTPPEREAEPAE